MTTLNLGVIDLPYNEGPGADASKESAKQRGKRLNKYRAKNIKYAGVSTSTGDVAEILENKYGIMAVFFEMYGYQIAGKLEEIIARKIEDLFLGGPTDGDSFAEVAGYAKECFSRFLSEREIEVLGITGVPTEAAQHGVSHRFKRPYVRRASRPSFVDTGLYEASFVAEIVAE